MVSGMAARMAGISVLGWSKKLVEASMQAQGQMQPKAAAGPGAGKSGEGAPAAPAAPKTQTRTGDLDNF